MNRSLDPRRSTRLTQNAVGEVLHDVKLAREFCHGCPSNRGGESFPICGEKCVTSGMVQAGSIIVEDITPPHGCLERK